MQKRQPALQSVAQLATGSTVDTSVAEAQNQEVCCSASQSKDRPSVDGGSVDDPSQGDRISHHSTVLKSKVGC
jgi:hypothetical protein